MRGIATLVFSVFVAHVAHAQNDSSQKLLNFSEDQRNAVWGELLRRSGETCTRVSRTMLQGAQAPDIALTSIVSNFAHKVSDPLPGEVEAQAVREATMWLAKEPLLKSAAAAAGDPADK